MEAMWRKMSGTNDITNRLTAFVHVISCTCGGPVNTTVPVSDHERLLSIIRSLSQCKSVCSWNTGENQTAYSTGSGKKYVLIEQLRIIKLHKDKATCSSTGLIVIFWGFRRCSQSCRTKHSLLLMLCRCERLLHLNVSC